MTSEIITSLIKRRINPLIKVRGLNDIFDYPEKWIGTSERDWRDTALGLMPPEMIAEAKAAEAKAAEAKAAAKKGGRHSRRHPRRHRGSRGGSSRMRSRGKRTSKKRNMRH